MIEQKATSRFYLRDKHHAVDPSGTEVELPNRDDLIYRTKGEELILRIDFDFVGDVCFTTHVFLPKKLYWISGRPLTKSEIVTLQIDIRDALVAFDSLVLFKGHEWVEKCLNQLGED